MINEELSNRKRLVRLPFTALYFGQNGIQMNLSSLLGLEPTLAPLYPLAARVKGPPVRRISVSSLTN
jgi:hypothetical protein